MKWYSVFGIAIEEELVVAGVVEGRVATVDDGRESEYRRWCEWVQAETPTDAETEAMSLHRLA